MKLIASSFYEQVSVSFENYDATISAWRAEGWVVAGDCGDKETGSVMIEFRYAPELSK